MALHSGVRAPFGRALLAHGDLKGRRYNRRDVKVTHN